MTSEEQFLSWVRKGYNIIPVVSEMLGDFDTPLGLYLKLKPGSYSFLLESGFDGECWGRYSFIGLHASTRIIVNNNQVTYITDSNIQQQFAAENPLDEIEKIFNHYKVPKLPVLSRFYGGFVGYFGYDTIRYIEPRLANAVHQDNLNIPDIYLLLPEQLLIHDAVANTITIIHFVNADRADYASAVSVIKNIKQRIREAMISLPSIDNQNTSNEFISNFERDTFENSVETAKTFFEAGDVMQLILSQRFQKKFTAPPILLYRTLKHLNPSPYMYYFDLEDFQIVGASPEILVRLEQQEVTVRPLAGTRRRGKTSEEDQRLAQELLSDHKEIAEHLMLIDLGRNDIGRVCNIGTVKVIEQMVIEKFSHVMHISSTVTGQLKDNTSAMAVLKATFPAGTVSGAPKIRAMEIIDKLEQEKRGLYGGAVGYLAWNGNLDMAIALRTAIIKNNTIYIQTGAGLVADSNPAQEWQECINKAKALFLATELTEQNKSLTS